MSMTNWRDGMVAVVTGAASGIGLRGVRTVPRSNVTVAGIDQNAVPRECCSAPAICRNHGRHRGRKASELSK